MFGDFIVETLPEAAGDRRTTPELNAHYDPIGGSTRLMNNLFLSRVMARREKDASQSG